MNITICCRSIFFSLFILFYATVSAQFSPITATATLTGNGCNRGNTVTLNVQGGVPPYFIQVNNAENSYFRNGTAELVFSSLNPGDYTFTIYSSDPDIPFYSLQQIIPAAYSVSFTNSPAYCNPNQTAQSQYTFTGISTPYNMYWSSGAIALNQNLLTGNAFLDAGNHRVTTIDNNNCELYFATSISRANPGVVVNVNAPLNVLCDSVNTCSLNANLQGGTWPYSYLWSFQSGTATTQNLSQRNAGTYNLRVTDNNGCRYNNFKEIYIAHSPLHRPVVLQPSCLGNNGRAGFVNLTGPYSYTWYTMPVQNTAVAQNLPPGIFQVQITNTITGCGVLDAIRIPDSLSGDIFKVNATCPNANGKAWLSNINGTGPYSYLWSSGETADTAFALAGGSRQIRLSDTQGCVSTIPFFMQAPDTSIRARQSPEITGCPGALVYSDTIFPSGGSPPYQYFWHTQPVQTTQHATVLTIGTMNNTMIHVVDANTCTHSQFARPTSGLRLTAQTVPATCGNADGSATVFPQMGVAPYRYYWNTVPPQYTQTAIGLSVGTWYCSVYDTFFCNSSIVVTIPQASPQMNIQSTIQHTSCDTAQIWVTVGSGTPPFTYSWNTSPPVYSDTLHGMPFGTYTCTIQDGAGCVDSIIVNHHQSQLLLSSGTHNHSCSNSLGWAVPQGGQAPYAWSWNTIPPVLVDTARNLAPGTYTCIVSDISGCIDSASIVIPITPMVIQTAVLPSGCSNGKAWVTSVGGISPFSYSWNTQPPQVTDTIRNLNPGTYRVRVTDNTGCADSVQVSIYSMNTSVSQTLVNPICTLTTSGSARLTVHNGSPPYTYLWNTMPVQTTATATGLPQGIYLWTVTDINGCVFQGASTLVHVNFAITAIQQVSNPAVCGQNNGSAAVNLSANQLVATPFTVVWNTNPPQTGPSITAVSPGTYTWTAHNSQGCTGTGNVTILNTQVQLQASSNVLHASCLLNDGVATIQPLSGTPPFSWTWNTIPAQSTQTITGLPPGPLTYSFTDAFGCSGSGSVTIQQGIIHVNTGLIHGIPAFCPTYATGTVVYNVTGGTPPYSYLWSNSQTVKTPVNLTPGIYSVIVTDTQGCTDTSSVQISSASPVSLNSTFGIAHCQQSDGDITVYASGGQLPYTYVWQTIIPSPNQPTLQNLPAGIYPVTVTDAQGCSSVRNVILPQTPCGTVIISGRILNDLNGNGQEDPGETGMAGRQVTLINPLTTTFTNAQGYYTFPPVPIGVYTITTQTPGGFIQSWPAQNQSLTLQAFTPGLTYYFNDFRYFAGTPGQDMRVSSCNYMPARRGYPFTQLVKVQNSGNIPVQPWLNVAYPLFLNYTNTSFFPVQHDNLSRTLNYQIPLMPAMTDTTIHLDFITDILAPIGQTVYFQNQTGPLAGDINLTNNAMNSGAVLTAPYDPNDNMLIPDYVYGKKGDLGIMDSVLTYRIRFQNTGNDTAFNIFVVDTLDAALKRETLEVLMSTHYVETSIDSAGKIRFYFPNILLPDSLTNEAGSHGAVFFRVTGKVQPGYTVKNTAHIYFDFNEAIVTNTSEYTWLDLEIMRDEELDYPQLQIYPNPSTSNWKVFSSESCHWSMYSMEGVRLQSGEIKALSFSDIQGEALPAGMYFLEIEYQGRQKTLKLIRN